MIKKHTSLLLATLMLVSLAACTNSGGEPSPTPTESTESVAPESTSPVTTAPSTPSETVSPDAVTSQPSEAGTVKYGVLNGPTGLGVTGMYMKNQAGETANSYEIVFAGAPDEMIGKITSGEVDMAAIPTNLASTLHSKTNGGIQQLANITLGVLYIVENGETVQTIDDLKGKTIYATGQGSNPEYVLNYILEQNGLTDEVTIEYKSEHSELATLVASDEVEIAMLPEPFVTSVTTQNSDIRIALDINDEWESACEKTGNSNSLLVMSSIVAKKEYIEANPDAIDNFMKDYAESVAYVTDNPAEAAAYIEEQGILGMKAAIAEKAIPNCKMVFLTGEEMKDMTSNFLQVLFDANPQSIGGAMPADDFYHGQ